MSETEVNMSAERAEAQDFSSGSKMTGKPGALLLAERMAQGLSVDQVADQLKLAPRQIMALEADDYAALPGMAIVRGFVRAYAKYLRLDAAPLVAMITVDNGLVASAQPVRREMATPFSETRMPSMSRRSMTPFWLLGSGLVFCLILVLAWLHLSGSQFPPTLATLGKQAASASVSSAPTVVPASGAVPSNGVPHGAGISVTPLPNPVTSNPTDPVPPTTAPTIVPTIVPTIAPTASPTAIPTTAALSSPAPTAMPVPTVAPGQPLAVADGKNLLTLQLRADSWVEVKRPNGQVLVSRLLKAGATENIDMSQPVQLVIGNVSGVDATLRGNLLNLKTGSGNTARVVLK